MADPCSLSVYGEGVYFGLQLEVIWSVMRAKHGSKAIKQLCTLSPQSGNREMNAGVQPDFPFYVV